MEKKKLGIILLTFGTSKIEGYEKSLRVISEETKLEFNNCRVELVFTSNILRELLFQEHGINILSLEACFESFRKENIDEVIIQPLNIFVGKEDERLVNKINLAVENQYFSKITIGNPLLPYNKNEFLKSLLKVINEEEKDENTFWVLMGHGSKKGSNEVYLELQKEIINLGYHNIIIGTLEGEPSIHSLVKEIKKTGRKKLNLMPLLLSLGGHVIKDMAGEDKNSWKSILQEEGFEVYIINKGLGEYKYFREIYLQNIRNLKNKICLQNIKI